jgi:hypothetical protein
LLLIRPKKDYTSYVGKNELQAERGVEVIRLDVYPTGLMSAPFVDQLADVIRTRLNAANQDCHSSFVCQTGSPSAAQNGAATQVCSQLATS